MDEIVKWGIIVPHQNPNNDDSLVESWVVIREYVFWSDRYKKLITIPKWFVTDLGSVPRGLRWLVPKSGKLRIPSILHDYGYAFNQGLTRSEWDTLLDDFCKVFMMGPVRRSLVNIGVRIGGSSSFNKKGHSAILEASERKWYVDNYLIEVRS